MTTTHSRRLLRRTATGVASVVAMALLAACGAAPYAADAGSGAATPGGGGPAGSSGGSTGSAGLPTIPDMPTDPAMTHGPIPDPDAASSATQQPGQVVRPSVTGRVTDGAGEPVTGALVSVVSHGDPVRSAPELAVLTGLDGRYSWPTLPPGSWEVRVTRDRRTAMVPVVIVAGRTATADLVLR